MNTFEDGKKNVLQISLSDPTQYYTEKAFSSKGLNFKDFLMK